MIGYRETIGTLRSRESNNMSQTVTALGVEQVTLDPATQAGVEDLIAKIEPLLQARRFHNLVDLLSLLSDSVDLADDAMIQKLVKALDEAVGGAWTLGNAARYAAAQTSAAPPPSVIGLVKAARDEDVRRGLHFAVTFLAVLGRQLRDDDAS